MDYADAMQGSISIKSDLSDFLTGLVGAGPARDWLDTAEAVKTGAVKAMLVSLPRLQSVNLAYGKPAGDQVLVEMAHRIREFAESEIGADTLIARLAGGQFLIGSQGVAARDRWQYLAEALGRVIGRVLTVEDDALHLVPRIALLEARAGDTGDAMIDRLAQAAATLERLPGRRVLWADEGESVPGASIALLEADLLGAMHRDEIAILFQPQFDIVSGALAGAEALARWQHPRFGRIAAETLFAVADRGDHVAQLSHHIATRSLALAAQWPDPGLRLSLNVTAEDFALGDVTGRVRALVKDSGFAADRLTLEITEQALIGDFDACARALQELADDGVQVALDDFGTGYSNFRALKVLPLDTLKLDRSLVRDIAQDPRDRAIVSAMIAMARALDLKVIAEGIETEAQRAILAEEGCDLFQGFLRAGPVSPEDFAVLARQPGISSPQT
ncbi:bifunctional diguanylate cyclase/phosphodiesterase [Novosphingobium sp. Fuku2-ISO-50]|uniref:bifunctional diguanylate cyclase/phosphodiesterase n=1 Tax=Novosphingobium sp. Fuku2-ISO-50 TaxID=1739114 RepID=UPI000A84984D|nr:bifunctional diguanylate cyclase/phosphodiesterase [Novosphingobium sp. Fuku2-ISO-50]